MIGQDSCSAFGKTTKLDGTEQNWLNDQFTPTLPEVGGGRWRGPKVVAVAGGRRWWWPVVVEVAGGGDGGRRWWRWPVVVTVAGGGDGGGDGGRWR